MSGDGTGGLLRPYRLLDLTAGSGCIAAHTLGQLGMQAIRVVPPGGGVGKRGPLWGLGPGPESDLNAWTYGRFVGSLSLDLEDGQDREWIARLERQADIVLEDFRPGYLDTLGLGYADLSRAAPGVSMVSITPLGFALSYDSQASELTLAALSGLLNQTGSEERAPVWPSWNPMSHVVGLNAAVACLLALEYRSRYGRGQHVDVSAYDCAIKANVLEPPLWDFLGVTGRRLSGRYSFGATRYHRRIIWECRDGYVAFLLQGGVRGARDNQPLIRWMTEEGLAGGMEKVRWEAVNPAATPAEEMRAWEEALGGFFRRHSKRELLDRLVAGAGSLFAPLFEVDDVLNDPHLEARSFWVSAEFPGGQRVRLPGPLFVSSEPDAQRLRPVDRLPAGEAWADQEGDPLAMGSHKAVPESTLADGPHELLRGLKVLDFSWVVAGPLATKCMADFGAQVIKVESPDRPDVLRAQGPFLKQHPGSNISGNFVQLNSGKLSLPLDLKNPAGMALARKLVAWADLVVENFKPGTMESLGLGYEQIHEINPSAVMVSISSWGQFGPYSHARGNALSSAAAAGQYTLTGWPGGPPEVQSQGTLGDAIPGYFALISALAAIDYRRRTGRGQHIDISQVETLLHTIGPAVVEFGITGKRPERRGNRNPNAAPHGVFRCRGEDAWCAIAVFTDEQWAGLCEVLGHPALSRDARFATLALRKEHEPELERLVDRETLRFTPWDLMAALQRAGVPAGAVQTVEHFLSDAHARDRQTHVWLEHPGGIRCRYPAPPLRFSDAKATIRRAPSLGEHTELVCSRILGLTDEAFVEALGAGAFGPASA